jgi:hypothetical protein
MYKFIDIEDPVEEEEKEILARRLREYGSAALAAGSSVEHVHVKFTEFKESLDACDRIFQLATAFETPHGMILTGPPGSSKTTLADYFIKSLPPSDLFEPGFGAIMFRLRTAPSQGHVVSGLLRALKYPLANVRRGRVFAMRDVAFEALRQRGTRLVFVDQAHCLSTQSRSRHADVLESGASDTLREMMEETKVGLVLLADASFRGLNHVDKALDDRVTVKMSMSHFEKGEVWEAFLVGFRKMVKCVNLGFINTERGSSLTMSATEGNRRTFRRLIVETVMVTVEDGLTVVAEEHFKRAFDLINGRASTRSNPYGR